MGVHGRDDRGMQENRKCRDVLFLILWLAFWCGMWGISGTAWGRGDVRYLWYPRDSYNHTCGLSNGYEDESFLYFPGAPIGDFDTQLCTSQCPNQGDFFNPIWCIAEFGAPNSKLVPGTFTCLYDTIVDGYEPRNDDLVSYTFFESTERCWCNYPTSSLLRRCIPEQLNSTNINATLAATNVHSSIQSRSHFAEIFGDIISSWQIIFGMLFVSTFLCFVWLILVSLLCKPIVWLTVLGFLVMMVAISAFFWDWRAELRAESQAEAETSDEEITTSFDVQKSVSYFAYFWTALTVIAWILVIALRKRIMIAIEIVDEASKAVRAMPMIVFFPIFIFFLLVLFLCYWGSVTIYIAAIYAQIKSGGNPMEEDDVHAMGFFWLFAFFWNVEIILALQQIVIAGGIASWYWSGPSYNIPSRPVEKAFERVLRYHLGSVCFGALIIAIVQMIRTIVYYFQEQVEGRKNPNVILRWLLRCVQCCLLCVERFLKFINKNAYIMIAVYGQSFCTSAARAWTLLLNNVLRVAAVAMVSEYMIFLGKLLVTLLSAVLAMHAIRQDPLVGFWFFPVLLVAVFAFFISTAFFHVYEMAIDTILLCFLDESELIKDGTVAEANICMSKDLQAFVKKTHKTLQDEVDARGGEMQEKK